MQYQQVSKLWVGEGHLNKGQSSRIVRRFSLQFYHTKCHTITPVASDLGNLRLIVFHSS